MSDSVDIILRLRGERIVAQKLKKSGRDWRKYGREVDDTTTSTRGLNKELRVTASVFKLVKPAALITGIALLGQFVSALTGGFVALVAAMAPALGAFAALPGLGVAVAGGIGVANLALLGMKDAIGGLNEELDLEKLAALTPEAQYLAVELDSLKQPILDLQGIAQDGILPGLMEAAKEGAPAIAALEPIVERVAGVIGTLIDRTLDLVGSWKGDIDSVGQSGAQVLGALGLAGIALAGALWHVLIAAQPLTLWIARSIQLWAQSKEEMAAAGRESGTMASYFDLVRDTLERIGRLIDPVMGALGNVFNAALPSGQRMLDLLTDSAERFEAWSGSLDGQSAIRTWFNEGMPAMIEAGRLLRDLVKGFFELGNGKQVAPLLQMIRTDLLPVLGNLVKTATTDFAPVFITALTQIVGLFAQMTGAGAPVAILVGALGDLAEMATWVLREVPYAKEVIVALVAAMFVSGGAGKARKVWQGFRNDVDLLKTAAGGAKAGVKSVVGGVQNMISIMKDGRAANSAFTGKVGATVTAIKNGATAVGSFSKALIVNTGHLIKNGAMAAASGVKTAGIAIATGVATAAQWLWNAALIVGAAAMAVLTSPITLIVLGIVAMIAVIVLVVKNWDWLKAKMVSFGAWALGAMAAIGSAVSKPLIAAAQWVKDKFVSMIDFFKSMPGAISSATKGLFNGIKEAFKSAINWIIDRWNTLEFKIPEIDPPGPGKIPGMSFGTPDIPMLAAGGIVPAGQVGSWITGEAGAERNTMQPDGSIRVQPLTKQSAAPDSAIAEAAARRGGGGDGPRNITLEVDGKVLATVVDEHVGDEGARR